MPDDSDPFMGGPLDLPESQPAHHDPLRATTHHGRSRLKKVLIILGILIVLAGVGFGIFKLLNKNSPASNSSAETPAASPPPPSISADVPESSETKTYDNGPMGLTLTHPATWQSTETTDSGVRLESPTFSYETLDKGDVTGNFRIYIRKGARPVDGKYIGRGIAILPSEKVVYAKPAVGQRADTLVSFFGLDEPDNFNFFFVAGNFQLKVGDTLGPDYGKEPETFIIGGGYSSPDIKEDLGFNSVDPDTIATSNAYKQALDIIKSLELH